jgi:hypothetical protein
MSDQQIILALAAAGGLLLLALLLVIGYLLGSRSRRGQPALIEKGQLTPIDLSALAALPGADALAPAFTTLSAQLGEVREKVQLLQTAAAVEDERRRQEAGVWETIRNVDRTLATFSTEERQRWGPEDSAFTSLQRLTAVMLGSARVGATGERLVQDALSKLPDTWRITNHKVGSKVVEFAVRLPDELILPIDSKVVAQEDLDQLAQATDPAKQRQLERTIQGEILKRIAEVEQYVDKRTPGFGIAAVSDAAYAVAGPILAQAYTASRVIVVSYSLLLPFVLLIVDQHKQRSVNLDAAEQARLLDDIKQRLTRLDAEINGRLSGALKQLTNSKDELEDHVFSTLRLLEQLRQSSSAEAKP